MDWRLDLIPNVALKKRLFKEGVFEMILQAETVPLDTSRVSQKGGCYAYPQEKAYHIVP